MPARASRPDGHWLPAAAATGAPAALRPWLTDGASLTARLAARCNRLNVRVLRQGLVRPAGDERRMIGSAAGRLAWVREVLLLADGVPVVFAHSILAPTSLRGHWRIAAGIGGRPLGAALFADPRIRRGTLHARRLDGRHPLHRAATRALGDALPALWARRSCFFRAGHPLLVTEVFLPGIAVL
jgi:chorismate--pyruvate lyase